MIEGIEEMCSDQVIVSRPDTFYWPVRYGK